MERATRPGLRARDRILIGALVFVALVMIGIGAARAAEIVPSVGIARATSGDGSVKTFAGVALRGSLAPMVKSEIGLAYRNEPYFNGDLNVRMWPVTGSVWFAPLPMFYVGGGAGWYHTTYDYKVATGLQDRTSQEFGTHVGGGLSFPLVPMVASLDLNARYVKMRNQASPLSAEGIKQSYVSTTLGVAVKF